LQNEEIAGFQETRIGRDQISGRQAHDVTGHNIASPKFLPFPIAQHGGGRCDLLAQLLDGSLRFVGLGKVEGGTEQDDDGNDRRVRRFAEKGGNGSSDQQYQHKWIQEQAQKVENR
jgi:hypothetical protein